MFHTNFVKNQEEVNCTGCVSMSAPFWGGICEVKSCVELKQLNHCGECEIFPCEMMSTMGTDQGFDPTPRIENCKKWAME